MSLELLENALGISGFVCMGPVNAGISLYVVGQNKTG